MTASDPPGPREVRLERLHPTELHAAMAAAPVAWLPLGALEYHADHLPYGTDSFTAHEVVTRAARRVGGVVLPPSVVTIGTLHLEWSFRYDPALVEANVRQTIEQLAAHGARVVVVHTGHAPLDLIHLIKRVCAEAEAGAVGDPDFRAYGLCYLELNAALGANLGSDWPAAVDHGSVVETSWMLAIEPELVHLDRLPDETDEITGIYGPHPRDRASSASGDAQIGACARLLAERVAGLLGGARRDPMADLRTFVERYWPEPLEVAGRAGAPGEAALHITNLAPVSRYLTSIDLAIDGTPIDASTLVLVNETPGESGAPLNGDALGPETGLYVRRCQTATVRLPQSMAEGGHRVVLDAGLAGVTEGRIERIVAFR